MKEKNSSQVAVQKAKDEFANKIQLHLQEEYGVDMGRFEAEELFDEALREVVPALYNQALMDARDFFQERVAIITEDIIQLEIAPSVRKVARGKK